MGSVVTLLVGSWLFAPVLRGLAWGLYLRFTQRLRRLAASIRAHFGVESTDVVYGS